MQLHLSLETLLQLVPEVFQAQILKAKQTEFP